MFSSHDTVLADTSDSAEGIEKNNAVIKQNHNSNKETIIEK